jgi:hypothetical protein
LQHLKEVFITGNDAELIMFKDKVTSVRLQLADEKSGEGDINEAKINDDQEREELLPEAIDFKE